MGEPELSESFRRTAYFIVKLSLTDIFGKGSSLACLSGIIGCPCQK